MFHRPAAITAHRKNDWIRQSFLIAILLLAGSLTGHVAGAPLAVEAADVGLYREWLLRQPAGSGEATLPRHLAQLDHRAVVAAFDRHELGEISRSHSADLATLLFVRSVLADPENARLNAAFTIELEHNPRIADDMPSSISEVLFVPGFLYRTHPETGGDFASSRRLLTSIGMANKLIETDESGSIQRNAALVADAVRQRSGRRLIVVSASKAGAEVALALGELLDPAEARSVVGWINIGGLLGGSPLADRALRPPRRWLLRTALWWKGLDLSGVLDLRTTESRRRLATLEVPPEIVVLNVVAAPLRADVSQRAADGYRQLSPLGPNDGLALLTDQVLPGSRTIVRLGDDHFFSRHSPEALTRALLRIALRTIPPPRETDR